MPSDDFSKRVEIHSGRWKGKGSKKKREGTTRHREVCNTFHNVILNLIIINLYIKFGTSNIFQHFHRFSNTSNATKTRHEKIGQHKLGPGGYSNLVARIVSFENPIMHRIIN